MTTSKKNVVLVKPEPFPDSLPSDLLNLLNYSGWKELFSLSTATRGRGSPPWRARSGVVSAITEELGDLPDKLSGLLSTLSDSASRRDNDAFEAGIRDVERHLSELAQGKAATPRIVVRPTAKIKKEDESSLIDDFGAIQLEDHHDFRTTVRMIAVDVDKSIPDLISFQAVTQDRVSSLADSFAIAAGLQKPKRQHFMLAWCHVLKTDIDQLWTQQDIKDALSLFIASQLAFDELGWNVVERLVSVKQLGLSIDNDSVERAVKSSKPKRKSYVVYPTYKKKEEVKAPRRGRPSK